MYHATIYRSKSLIEVLSYKEIVTRVFEWKYKEIFLEIMTQSQTPWDVLTQKIPCGRNHHLSDAIKEMNLSLAPNLRVTSRVAQALRLRCLIPMASGLGMEFEQTEIPF